MLTIVTCSHCDMNIVYNNSINKFDSFFIMYDLYSTTFKYGNYNTYGELCLDDVNVWDFEFPLTADELEDAVNEQIGQAEAQAEALIADYYTY